MENLGQLQAQIPRKIKNDDKKVQNSRNSSFFNFSCEKSYRKRNEILFRKFYAGEKYGSS